MSKQYNKVLKRQRRRRYLQRLRARHAKKSAGASSS